MEKESLLASGMRELTEDEISHVAGGFNPFLTAFKATLPYAEWIVSALQKKPPIVVTPST